jgi:protease IV
MNASKFEWNWEKVRSILLWIALPLVAGILVAAAIPQPVVGTIYLRDAIYASTASTMLAQIDYARNHPEISAVVLVLDSPGGTVADTEAVYLELLKLRKTKPVVVSINSMAASGAYYLTSAADYAFAKPTSDVGNIGVIGYLPPVPIIYEGIISTGPYKLWGWPRDTYTRQIEMIKQGFYGAVQAGRGTNLKIGPEVVLSGRLWTGSEAQRLGLIDALGAQSDAVEKAASLANIRHYKVADLAELLATPASSGPASFFAQSADGTFLPYPQEAGIYLLYIPPLPAQGKK